ncbi:MAG: hypothetical protein OXH52_02130 [Gammaproteobacteria bacterium]|nr:hypothetical protein [Gammaproteobacteria bacterium]
MSGGLIHLEWERPGLGFCGQIDVATVEGPPDAVTCTRCHAYADAAANRRASLASGRWPSRSARRVTG